MVEHVLTVACTVLQSSENFHKVVIYAVYARLKRRFLARLAYCRLDLFLCTLDGLLNACGMYASVGYELLKCEPRSLAAHGVKTRESYRLGSVVYNKVAPRHLRYCTDIPSLSAYSPALHIVARQRYYRYGSLRYVVGCVALNRRRDYLVGELLAVLLELSLRLGYTCGGLVLKLVVYRFEQLGFRLLGGKSRYLLKLYDLLTYQFVKLSLLFFRAVHFLRQRFFLFFKRFVFVFDCFLTLHSAFL